MGVDDDHLFRYWAWKRTWAGVELFVDYGGEGNGVGHGGGRGSGVASGYAVTGAEAGWGSIPKEPEP